MTDYYLDMWSGDFGNRYTQRCDVKPESRVDIFKELIPLGCETMLEVGCNKGHNLEAIKIFNTATIVGIEPNKSLCKSPNIINGDAYNLPWADNTFDLVFTAGVLIHIPEDRLAEALTEIYRVSGKYIMMIEYYSPETEGKQYRDFGSKKGLWSRPYGDIFSSMFNIKNIKEGKVRDIGNDGWGFSDSNYWIYKK